MELSIYRLERYLEIKLVNQRLTKSEIEVKVSNYVHTYNLMMSYNYDVKEIKLSKDEPLLKGIDSFLIGSINDEYDIQIYYLNTNSNKLFITEIKII